MYKVKYYKDDKGNEPVREYLKQLDQKAKSSKNERINLNKILEYIETLKNYGTYAGEPYVKHIRADLWELRPLDSRIFFFFMKDDAFILLHHFIKKTKRTPKREIEQAERNMKNVIERSKSHE